MSITDEIERLAKLRDQGTLTADEFARAKAIVLSGGGLRSFPFRCVRRQSARTFCGLPLWSIAFGSGALGAHTLSVTNRDPAALEFFQRYLPFLKQLFEH